MLIQHWGVGHAQYVWDVRQNPRVRDVFEHIWETDDLLVSFDGVSYHLPPEAIRTGWYRGNDWLHVDQSYTDNSFKCVQGWVTANKVNPGDATLTVLVGSHLIHGEFQKAFGVTDKDNWYKLTEEQKQFYLDRGCSLERITCPAGSLVLWDSRTVHCGTEAMKTRKEPNLRNVAYVCYQPRSKATTKAIEKRIKVFEELRMTSHWPANPKMFGKHPRTYGAELPDVTPLSRPVLNEVGRKLVGYV